VARGRKPAVVARVLKVSRQAIYRVPARRPRAARRRSGPPADEVEAAIIEVAARNQTDGYRMVAAMAARKLGRAVNRKRVLKVMRERRLIQRRRRLDRRRRPGFFQVTRPNELWHLDLTSVWVAEHGWCYLMAAIDCCTREIVGWHLELRCRAIESIALIRQAAAARAITPGMLTLGTDNGSAFTARAFKLALSTSGIAHRRGGYRDPESQAFIESWFAKLKERCVWLHEFETLDQAREVIAAHINNYHHRPHSGLDYRTPPRSPRPGTMPSDNYKPKRPEASTAQGCSPRRRHPARRTNLPVFADRDLTELAMHIQTDRTSHPSRHSHLHSCVVGVGEPAGQRHRPIRAPPLNPGKSQGRPNEKHGLEAHRSKRPTRLRSPKQGPCPGSAEPTARPGRTSHPQFHASRSGSLGRY
jgi:putative transposase